MANVSIGSSRSDTAVRPDAGIGLINIGESRARVERRLGPGHPVPGQPASALASFASYNSGSIALWVTYATNEHVDGIETSSSQATLYGRAFSKGYRALRARLNRAHGWKHFDCNHARIFTHYHRTDHTSTTVSFIESKFNSIDVAISAPRNGFCPAGSPVCQWPTRIPIGGQIIPHPCKRPALGSRGAVERPVGPWSLAAARLSRDPRGS